MIGLIIILSLILALEFVNGWTGSPYAITTVVSTRTLRPVPAVILATGCNVIGVFFGMNVAKIIGMGIIRAEAVDLVTLGAAVTGIIIWLTIAWLYKLPTSETYALIACLAGAGLATSGPAVLVWAGLRKVLIGLAISLLAGLIAGGGLSLLIQKLCCNLDRAKGQKIFNILQVISAGGMALGHGSNNGQKFTGVFTLALMLGGILEGFAVPVWGMAVSAVVMGLGTFAGGWRIIKTKKLNLIKIESYQGFAVESATAGSMLIASGFGVPLSATSTFNSPMAGVGTVTGIPGARVKAVKETITSLIVTFPICGAISYLAVLLFKAL